MANYCARCGIPLAVASESDYCSEHSGLALTPDAQVRCPFCREMILAGAKKCRYCGEFLSQGPASPAPRKKSYPIGSMYCTACGNVGTPRGMPKVELIFVLIVSLFTLFIPLMIYLFVRSGNRCRECGKKTLIPLSSPIAHTALETSETRPQRGPVPPVGSVITKPNRGGIGGSAGSIGDWQDIRRRRLIACIVVSLLAMLMFRDLAGLFAIGVIILFFYFKEIRFPAPYKLGAMGGLVAATLILQLLYVHNVPTLNSGNKTQPATAVPDRQAQGVILTSVPPPKFRVFKFKTDEPTTYVVPVSTTDKQLKSLLWLFRQKVRTGQFREIGITQPTAKQWGQLGYTSGILVVFRGEKCANENYISDAQIAKGNLGPCGYGEHDDAYYQWGVDADPNKDDAGIRDKNGNFISVFSYKDNWHSPSEQTQVVDQKVKEEWAAKQQEWEPRQRFAVQISNEFFRKGLDIHVSANSDQPKELDFRSKLFTDAAVRKDFINTTLHQLRLRMCNAGFQNIRILQESESDIGKSYPLHCQ
jgi:hypothetical protein